MGKEKGRTNCCQSGKEKGRNYCGGKEKAFTADEGTVGGKKESRKEVNIVKRRPAVGRIAWLEGIFIDLPSVA